MKTRLMLGTASVLTVGVIVILAGSRPAARTFFGPTAGLGSGNLQSYLTLDTEGAPVAVGVSITEGGLRDLPTQMNTESRCFDVNGDGSHARHECMGDYERILELPAAAADVAALPFKWIGVNWNPEGHMPPAPPVYAEPHFDFHFYTAGRERIEAIASGTCGELVDCGDFQRASKPIPAAYQPPGHIDVGAVVARMGNHLVDSQSPELQTPPARFTRTFIYGAFDGELIFWEPMITLAFLQGVTAECFPIRQPESFAVPGYYPTTYCVRHDEAGKRYTVSLEGFVYADAR
ncbi:MAG TPA: hypothetical protein VNL18_09995 [Gemmatimonadales bacterium]|nr:hypothetical protein [Gemmatimonadales bacterium]